MYVLDHCPAERSNDDPVLVFYDVHDAMYLNKLPRAFGVFQPRNITEPHPPPYLHTGYFRYRHSFLCQT